MHEVADLPHQGLVLLDYRLGGLAVVEEARDRHGLLELAQGLFGLGDTALQGLDAGLASLKLPALPFCLGVGLFFGLVLLPGVSVGLTSLTRPTSLTRKSCLAWLACLTFFSWRWGPTPSAN